MVQLEKIIQYIQDNPEVETTEINRSYHSSDPELTRKLRINPQRDGPFGLMTDLIVYPKKGLYSPENLSDFILKLIPPGVKPSSMQNLPVKDNSDYNQLMNFYFSRKLIFIEDLGKVTTHTNSVMEGDELIKLFGNKGGFYQGNKEKTTVTEYVHELKIYPRLSQEELKEFEIQFHKKIKKLTRKYFSRILRGEESKNVK